MLTNLNYPHPFPNYIPCLTSIYSSLTTHHPTSQINYNHPSQCQTSSWTIFWLKRYPGCTQNWTTIWLFLDFIDKLPTDWAWIPLSDIPHSYDELIEWFHHCHSALPKPTVHALKSKHHLPNPVSSPTNPPTVPTIPSHDPLALPPCPISPFDSECFTYQPPSITTTWSNYKSKPCNLHHVTKLITSNQPPRSSAP